MGWFKTSSKVLGHRSHGLLGRNTFPRSSLQLYVRKREGRTFPSEITRELWRDLTISERLIGRNRAARSKPNTKK